MNPRRHVWAYRLRHEDYLFLNLADYLRPLAQPTLAVKRLILNAPFTGPFGGVIVYTPPMMIAKHGLMTTPPSAQTNFSMNSAFIDEIVSA
jgi:hypothetical protein